MSTLTDQIKAKCKTIAENQQLIYEKGKSEGGGGGEPTTPTDNRTCLSYWYQGLVYQHKWYGVYDEDRGEEVWAGGILDELEYPKGTQNISIVEFFSTVYSYYPGEGMLSEMGALTKRFTGTLDLSNCNGDLTGLFYRCEHTEDFGTIIFPKKITSLRQMFYACRKFTFPKNLNTNMCTDFYEMFSANGAIEIAPMLDTSSATSVSRMYSYCYSLKEIPELDFRNVTNTSAIVSNCTALTKVRFKNIKVNTQIGSGTSYGHLINVEDLIFMIYHLRNTGSSKTFTIGSANLTKLANVYVKTIPITDAMRAEDDLIDEKLPFEVCESADSGAMRITDYVLYKNWTLK